MSKSMLTTVDNPFDPFTQFSDWLAFDTEMGYQTCRFLASFASTSIELSEADRDEAMERAIDQVVRLNPLGVFKRVRANVDQPTEIKPS